MKDLWAGRRPSDRLISLFALGFLWGWTSLTFFGMPSSSTPLSSDIWLINSSSLLASLIALASLPFIKTDYRSVMNVACVCATLGPLSSMAYDNSPFAFAFSGVVGGIGSIMMTFCLMKQIFISGTGRSPLRLFSCALVFAAVYWLIVSLPRHATGQMTNTIIPLLILLLFWISEQKRANKGTRLEDASSNPNDAISNDDVAKGQSEIRKFPWRLVIGLSIFGFINAIANVSLSDCLTPGNTAESTQSLYRGACGLVLLAICGIPRIGRKYSTVSTLGIICWIGAYLSSYAVPEWSHASFRAFSSFGYACFEMLMFCSIFEIAANTRFSFNITFSLCSFGMLLTTLLGQMIGCIFPHPFGLTTEAVLQIVVFSAVISALLFFDTKSISTLWNTEMNSVNIKVSSSESLENALREKCHLTPRECEVALLLAKGRSEPYIAETLFVSASTVHTHVRGIYSKMGVHSRQEFLDVIETRILNRQ